MVSPALAVALVLAVAQQIRGHARLTNPLPFNPNPSKALPCGGQNTPLSTGDIVKISYTQASVIEWQVIAADGEGPLTMLVDPLGGTNFSRQVTLQGNDPASLNTFDFTLKMPSDLPCVFNTTGNPYCTAQVASSSGWASCFAFTIGPFDTGLQYNPAATQCVTAPNNLGFCGQVANNQQVVVPAGVTATTVNGLISAYYSSVVNNTYVFSVGLQSSDCTSQLTYYLCETQMPFCGKSAYRNALMTQQYCQKTMTACGLTPQHKDLFNCSALPAAAQTAGVADVAESSNAWLALMLAVGTATVIFA